MPSPENPFADLAVNLATELITRGAARLRDAAFGDDETRALRRAWEDAFAAMLDDVAADLSEEQADLLDSLLRDFVRAEGVADALLDLALADREPDLALLRQRFNALGYDAATLQVDFDAALTALTRGLTDALLETAMEPDSPLYNQVSLGRLRALQGLLAEQGRTLERIKDQLQQLDSGGRTVYNLFIRQAQGVAIGDQAIAQIDPGLRPLVEQILGLLTALTREYKLEDLTLGIRELPTNYGHLIEKFVLDYVGTPEAPVPFGGREQALQELDAWLDADKPPCLLLAAPAGRGKSALLVRWLKRLRKRDPDLPIVFVPVSLSYNTASRNVFFAALAARLAHLHGEKVPADLDNAPAFWRGMVSRYLNQSPPDGRLLVVVDGLDEASDWEASPDLFTHLPDGVRVVASARYYAGDRGPQGWLRRLGWERHGLARTLDLDPLTSDGVADVLEGMGFPLAELGRRVDIVAELHRLSEGDPLLLRLYVDDLWARGERAVRLRPEDLRSLQPGLGGYFKRWWGDLRKQWGDKAYLKERDVREVLNLLAAALAPLTRDDVQSLNPELSTWRLEEALQPLSRLVIGDGREQGYVLSHPRLGQYFWEKLSQNEQQRLEERFLQWGWETLEALKVGRLAPRETSAYLVRALGSHLARSDAVLETWLRLVDGAWAAASDALEGAYGLFARDLERAWRACTAVDTEHATRDDPAPYLGQEVRCALVEASIHSLAKKIPPELLVALVENGVWTPDAAMVYARQMPDEGQHAEVLAGLAPHLPEGLLGKALATAKDLEGEFYRARALSSLVTRLPEDLREQTLRETLITVQGIKWESNRVYALAGLAPHLPERLLREALTVARDIKRESSRVHALASLAPHLPKRLLEETLTAVRDIRDTNTYAMALASLAPHLPENMLREALAAARDIKHTDDRAIALTGLAPHLPKGLRDQILQEAMTAARNIGHKDDRAYLLVWLAPHLPEDLREQTLRDALVIACETELEYDRADILTRLAPHLPDNILQEALSVARNIDGESSRAVTLAGLAPYLPNELLQEALTTLRNTEWEYVRADALGSLVPNLPEVLLRKALTAVCETELESDRALASLAPHLPEDLLREALAVVQDIGDTDARTCALASLSPHLPDDILREVLTTARDIEGESNRAAILAGLAPHLSERLLGETLTATWDEWEYVRVKALIGIVPYLSEEFRKQAMGAALTIAKDIKRESVRAKALASLAPHLSEGLLRKALTAARVLTGAFYRSRVCALTSLAPHLTEDLLQEALSAARDIEREYIRAEALTGLAPYLSEELLWEATIAAQNIGRESARNKALVGLAPHLPDELLGETLAAARNIERESIRAEALIGLAPHLPKGLLEKTLAFAQDIEDAGTLARALVGLAPHVSEDQREQVLREALDAARNTTWSTYASTNRTEFLISLAPNLSEDLRKQTLKEAFSAARDIKEEQSRAEALTSLAPHLPENLRKQALKEAFSAIRNIKEECSRAEALASVSPHLSDGLRKRALEETFSAAQDIKNEKIPAEVLTSLAPYLPEDLLREALTVARDSEREFVRNKVLVGLTPHLSDNLLQEALIIVRDIKVEFYRARALAGMVPHLPEDLLGDALSIAWDIEMESTRTEILASLPPHLTRELLQETLDAVRDIEGESSRAEILASLASHLVRLPRSVLYPLWAETLPVLARRSRKNLLSDIRALKPVIYALGGEQAIVETFHAIQDVGRWWP